MEGMQGGNWGVVLSLFCVMGIGWMLGWRKVIGNEGAESLVRLIGRVALPASTGYQGLTVGTAGMLREAPAGILTALAGMIATFLLGMLVARFLRIPEGRKGLFTVLFSLSNTILVGLPVVEAFYTEKALPYVVYYFIGNTLMMWSAGAYLIKRDGAVLRGENVRFSPSDLRRVLSLPLIAFLAGLAINVSGLKLPSYIMDAVGYLERAATPLALLYAGLLLYLGGRAALRLQKGQLMVFAGRFLIGPAIMLAFCLVAGLAVPMRQVFVLEAAMPTMAQAVVFAGVAGADKQYAASALSWTLMLTILFSPLWVWALSLL